MFILRIVTMVFLTATCVPLWGAQLRVQGEVTQFNSRKPMSGVLVRIYKNGAKQHVMHTGALGRYSTILDNNASYVIRFSLPGHTTKCFAVDTHGPAWEDDKRIMDLVVEMTMFESIIGLDLSFFDLPLGIARFTPMTGLVSWNGEYEARVKVEADRLMNELMIRREQLANMEAATPAGRRELH